MNNIKVLVPDSVKRKIRRWLKHRGWPQSLKKLHKAYFPGFSAFQVETSRSKINGIIGGEGPPLLLLHGFPRTHLMWHTIANELARQFTVVATDLTGYGESVRLSREEGVNNFTKRSMAQDQAELMEKLGFDKFGVIGYDRGGRVAHRLAIDFEHRVSRLGLLELIPTFDQVMGIKNGASKKYLHWPFLSQAYPIPEKMLMKNRLSIYAQWGPRRIPKPIRASYYKYFRRKSVIHAMCEDYRASFAEDFQDEKHDLGRKSAVPTLVLWGTESVIGREYSVEQIWESRISEIKGVSLETNHALLENRPDFVLETIQEFWNGESPAK